MSISQRPELTIALSSHQKVEGGGQCPLSLGNWVTLPARRPCRSRAGGTARKDRQLRNHLLRGRRLPPQCLFTNRALGARETPLLFQARSRRCQPERRGCWGSGTYQDDHKQIWCEGRGRHVAVRRPSPSPTAAFAPAHQRRPKFQSGSLCN